MCQPAITTRQQPFALQCLNQHFKPVKDSVVANSGSYFDVQPHPYAQFNSGNKAYLLLIQNFSSRQHGLLLLSNNTKAGLSTISLPVFDRYDYELPQLQALGKDAFILPYSYKKSLV